MPLKFVKDDLYEPSVASMPEPGMGSGFRCRPDAPLVLVLSETSSTNIDDYCGWSAEQGAGILRQIDKSHPSEGRAAFLATAKALPGADESDIEVPLDRFALPNIALHCFRSEVEVPPGTPFRGGPPFPVSVRRRAVEVRNDRDVSASGPIANPVILADL